MKAARLHAPRDLRIDDVPAPELRPDAVLVNIGATGICGSDVHIFQDGRISNVHLTEPLILGHEISGTVAEVGEQVQGLEPGVKVAMDPGIPCGICEYCVQGHYNVCPDMLFAGMPPMDGGFCNQMVLPPSCLFPVPDDFTHGEGVLIETMAVGLHAVDLAHLKAGGTAAIFGCGPIGQTVVQCLQVAGAQDIIAVDPVQHRLDVATQSGATAGINPTEENPLEVIMDLTGGRGVDVALEAAGEPEVPGWCVEAARPGGRVVLIGIPADDNIAFKAAPARRKGLTIALTRRSRHNYPRCIKLVENAAVDLQPLVTHEFALDQISEAVNLVEKRSDGVIKAVITFNESGKDHVNTQ
jgi:L-iditol 2-dehydrogenase